MKFPSGGLPRAHRLAAGWRQAACALLAAILAPLGAAAEPATARAGRISLTPAQAAQVTELRGEWAFRWGHFVPPAQPPAAGAPAAVAPVPSSWNAVQADGKPAGSDGHASYWLHVDCPAGSAPALAVPAQRTALHLYVNGELLAHQGTPGADAARTWPAIAGRTQLTEPRPCPLAVVAHLANFNHRAGGFVRPLSVGPPELLAAQQRQRTVLGAALLGAYLVLGLIPLIFYLGRRRDATPLLFGLFCLTQGLYADMTGERLLLLWWAAQTPWELYLRLEYLAWFSTMGLFVGMVRKLFANEMNAWAVRVLLAACALGALAVLATPARVYSHLAPAGQMLSLLLGLYVTVAVARAARRGRAGAAVLLGGMAFLLLVLVIDLAQYNIGHTLRSVTPVGLLAFVLAPAVVLARRLARALGAEELRALEQRGKADLLLRTTKAGIYDWDVVLGEVRFSDRLKEMLGHAPDAPTVGWPSLDQWIHADDRARVGEAFRREFRQRAIKGGEVRHQPDEFRLVRADGQAIWVASDAIALTGSDGRTLRYICSLIDITAQRAMREKLAAQNAALEDNVRLREDMERMSRHDLKTPLNSIIGVTRMLREDPRMAPDQRELLGITERAGYRILEMVNLSLELARIEQGSYDFRPQAVNLREVLARVLLDTHGLAEAHGVAIREARAQAQPVHVRAEELLTYSIIANVLKNAVEASGSGGVVTVSLEPGDPVRLAVHNPGQVPAAVAERFFQKYITAGKSGGTGLGAYSARLMARVQEGDLTMRTGPEGTQLTLTLAPLAAEAVPALHEPQPAGLLPASTAPAGAPPNLAPWRVLVVDDDEYNRLILHRYLPSPPLEVETAVHGQAALAAAQRRWPDLVLIDMEMPVMNGPDAVRALRARQAAQGLAPPAIVMLSSNDDAESIARGLAAGCERYLVKPVRRETLLQVLSELQQLKQPVTGLQADLPLEPGPHGAPAGDAGVVRVDPDLLPLLPQFLASREALLRQMREALRSLADAQAPDAARQARQALRELAHQAAGGLALYGFGWAAAQARQIEREAPQASAEALAALLEPLAQHLATVQVDAAPAPVAG